MTLLDANQPEPSKTPRYIALAVLIVFLFGFFIWRSVRFDAEEKVVTQFCTALTSGDEQRAYTLWQPAESYTFKDFQNAWGANGYYGPVKSFQIESANAPSKSDSSVAVTVLVSPYQPFPKSDSAEGNKTKTIVIWVNRTTHSLSFPPPFSSRLLLLTSPQVLRASASPFPA